MTKEDDPFFSLIGMMQEEGKAFNPTPFFIGKIVATEPLTVQVGDITIDRQNMKISSNLLGGYGRKVSIAEAGATGRTGSEAYSTNEAEAFASHEHSIESVGIPDTWLTMTDGFYVGDEVVLLASEDKQQYVLLCKVV